MSSSLEQKMDVLVYMAGPLFSQAEREFLERMVSKLAIAASLDSARNFFLPHRDGGELGKGPSRKDVFRLDMAKLESCDVVVALLDGQDADSGTCIELGYAYSKHKRIFGLLTDFRAYCTRDAEPHRPNLMVWGTCQEGQSLFSDIDALAAEFTRYIHELQKNKLGAAIDLPTTST